MKKKYIYKKKSNKINSKNFKTLLQFNFHHKKQNTKLLEIDNKLNYQLKHEVHKTIYINITTNLITNTCYQRNTVKIKNILLKQITKKKKKSLRKKENVYLY